MVGTSDTRDTHNKSGCFNSVCCVFSAFYEDGKRGGERRLPRRKSSDQQADASNGSGWQARGGFNFLLHNSIIFQFFLNE